MYRFFIKAVKIEDGKPKIEAIEIARFNGSFTESIATGDILHLTKDMMLDKYEPAPVKVLNKEISFKTVFDHYIQYKKDIVINDILIDVDCNVSEKTIQIAKNGDDNDIVDVELPTLLELINAENKNDIE